MSADNYGEMNQINQDVNQNQNQNMNNNQNVNRSMGYNNDENTRSLLDEKDMRIEELKNIIDVCSFFLTQILEMKLKNSTDIQNALEKRIKELTDIIREKGLK